MATYSSLLIALIEGTLLGCAFFYILWLSAKKILSSKFAISWFIGSWLARMVFALCGFYLIAMGNWQLLLASLCGFIIGRALISRLIDVKTQARKTYLRTPTE
ncbi:MAG: F1F0 ATPase subunit 2 [Alphaproteobacteria bacterium]|jgi:F1F0 ATPase subunit 2